MKKKKSACGVRTGAKKKKKLKKCKNIEKSIECLLEGGGVGGPVPTANGTNKKKQPLRRALQGETPIYRVHK